MYTVPHISNTGLSESIKSLLKRITPTFTENPSELTLQSVYKLITDVTACDILKINDSAEGHAAYPETLRKQWPEIVGITAILVIFDRFRQRKWDFQINHKWEHVSSYDICHISPLPSETLRPDCADRTTYCPELGKVSYLGKKLALLFTFESIAHIHSSNLQNNIHEHTLLHVYRK